MEDREDIRSTELARISEAAQATRLMVAGMATKLDAMAHSQAKMDAEQDTITKRLNQFDVERALSEAQRGRTEELAKANTLRIAGIETQLAVMQAQKASTKQWAGTFNTVISTIAAVAGSIAAIFALYRGLHL